MIRQIPLHLNFKQNLQLAETWEEIPINVDREINSFKFL